MTDKRSRIGAWLLEVSLVLAIAAGMVMAAGFVVTWGHYLGAPLFGQSTTLDSAIASGAVVILFGFIWLGMAGLREHVPEAWGGPLTRGLIAGTLSTVLVLLHFVIVSFIGHLFGLRLVSDEYPGSDSFQPWYLLIGPGMGLFFGFKAAIRGSCQESSD
jgi:hypothetical protein